MEFFTDSNSWDSANSQNRFHESHNHPQGDEPSLGLFDRDMHEKLHMSPQLPTAIEDRTADHLSEEVPNNLEDQLAHIPADLPRHVSDQSPHQLAGHMSQQQIPEQYYSSNFNYRGTPLMSPNALAPQLPSQSRQAPFARHTPHGTPHGTPQLVAQQQAYSPDVSQGPGSDYGMYYKVRNSSGKITKQSPLVQWRTGSIPEDEFQLGDPALEVLDPLSKENNNVGVGSRDSSRHSSAVGEDLEQRLRDAIVATAHANSRSNSVGSLHRASSRRHSNASSNRTTPRIRPKLTSNSTDPSPSMRPYDGTDVSAQEELFLKSNYQNLMDGTHQHLGLSAADRIATDLRSKKTVHKIAEQERRNRMNTAISELAQVLGPDEDKLQTSKAATVERATAYIKKLKSRIAELEGQVGDNEGQSQSAQSNDGSSSVSPGTVQ